MSNKCPKCNCDNPDSKQFCGDCGTQLPSVKDIEDHIKYLYCLGEAHVGAGNLEAASDAFEEEIGLTTGKIYWGDLWAKSHFKLGEIYEKLGDTTKAIEHTEKFLEM